MRLLTILTLLMLCFSAIGQTYPIKKDQSHKTLTFYPATYIDTEYKYADSKGVEVIIQNSLPKGGVYADATEKNFGYRIFWTRVINETETPLEITINFPADSFAIPSTDYFKVFLPPDTMTLDKEILFSYGATGLISFIDTGLHKPTKLQRTINPKQECLFYIGVLFTKSYGAARAELVFKEQNLFYRIKGIATQFESTLIPCGKIVVKKLKR